MQIQIQIDGRLIDIDVYQTSKTVWLAEGEFEGSRVSVQGSSSGNAATRWRRVALRQGD